MAKSNETATPNHDAIAKRAYELYLQRGSVPGHELDDWLQAEAELSQRGGATERDEPSAPRRGGANRSARRRAADAVESQPPSNLRRHLNGR